MQTFQLNKSFKFRREINYEFSSPCLISISSSHSSLLPSLLSSPLILRLLSSGLFSSFIILLFSSSFLTTPSLMSSSYLLDLFSSLLPRPSSLLSSSILLPVSPLLGLHLLPCTRLLPTIPFVLPRLQLLKEHA